MKARSWWDTVTLVKTALIGRTSLDVVVWQICYGTLKQASMSWRQKGNTDLLLHGSNLRSFPTQKKDSLTIICKPELPSSRVTERESLYLSSFYSSLGSDHQGSLLGSGWGATAHWPRRAAFHRPTGWTDTIRKRHCRCKMCNFFAIVNLIYLTSHANVQYKTGSQQTKRLECNLNRENVFTMAPPTGQALELVI